MSNIIRTDVIDVKEKTTAEISEIILKRIGYLKQDVNLEPIEYIKISNNLFSIDHPRSNFNVDVHWNLIAFSKAGFQALFIRNAGKLLLASNTFFDEVSKEPQLRIQPDQVEEIVGKDVLDMIESLKTNLNLNERVFG